MATNKALHPQGQHGGGGHYEEGVQTSQGKHKNKEVELIITIAAGLIKVLKQITSLLFLGVMFLYIGNPKR